MNTVGFLPAGIYLEIDAGNASSYISASLQLLQISSDLSLGSISIPSSYIVAGTTKIRLIGLSQVQTLYNQNEVYIYFCSNGQSFSSTGYRLYPDESTNMRCQLEADQIGTFRAIIDSWLF